MCNMNTINIVDYIQNIFKNNSDGHDVAHTMRVYHEAMSIAAHHEECDKELVAYSSLLHDVDDHKLTSNKNNENARNFLKSQNVDDQRIEEICEIIKAVSYSKNKDRKPETIEGKIVQDADRLDAMGAIGIARTFAYGGKNGRSLEQTIEHFHEKLLLLKDEMNTDEAKTIANARHSFMESFLQEFEKEMGGYGDTT